MGIGHNPSALRSSNYGVPQTRSRLYFVMVLKELMDVATLKSMCAIVMQAMPAVMSKHRATLEDIRGYVAAVLTTMGDEPTSPPIPKETRSALKKQISNRQHVDIFWYDMIFRKPSICLSYFDVQNMRCSRPPINLCRFRFIQLELRVVVAPKLMFFAMHIIQVVFVGSNRILHSAWATLSKSVNPLNQVI